MALAMTVTQFCKEYSVSRSMLYKLWREGKGPSFFRVGNRRLISAQAADAWRAMLEVEEETRLAS